MKYYTIKDVFGNYMTFENKPSSQSYFRLVVECIFWTVILLAILGLVFFGAMYILINFS